MDEFKEADELIVSLGLCILEKREDGMDSNQSPRDLVLNALAELIDELRGVPDTVAGALSVAELMTYSGQSLMTILNHPNGRQRYGG